MEKMVNYFMYISVNLIVSSIILINIFYYIEDIDVCRSSNTHNNMICLSCHGPNDLTLGYVSKRCFFHPIAFV